MRVTEEKRTASYTAFNNWRCCHFISSSPAVKLSMFFYGNSENENADALKQKAVNLYVPMELNALAKLDFQWWIDNILQSGIQKSIYYRCIKKGCGAVRDDCTKGGR